MILRSFDPALGDEIWAGDIASGAECAAAVGRARAALPGWAAMPSDERAALLDRYADLLRRDAGDLAQCISRENGKPLWEARTEVASMIGKIALAKAAMRERAGEHGAVTDFGTSTLRHRPQGVMAVLGPYNFPGHLPNGHIVPALLAGNCVVFKPSELTPATGARVAELLHEAGIPRDVIQVVQGGRETGEALLDADVDGVLFTGSAAAGSSIRRRLVDRPNVILALELGGNNPLVAWDGQPDAIAEIVVQSAFISTGQRCTCARRLIIPRGPAGDSLVEAIAQRIGQLRFGAWSDPEEAFGGPLISERAAANARNSQDELIKLGAVPVRKMAAIEQRSAAFLTPGILEAGDAPLPDEEIFAPLLTVYRAGDFGAALGLANRTRFGLAAGLISEDDGLWDRFRIEARAGVVNRNRPTTGASGAMPFGGIGESGNHRPSGYYAADYCAFPVASLEAPTVAKPAALPGSSG